MTKENTGQLLSIYCPSCQKVTDKISFNLLREAKEVRAICPGCHRTTYIEYNGKYAEIWHQDDNLDRIMEEMGPEKRKEFLDFISGKKKPPVTKKT